MGDTDTVDTVDTMAVIRIRSRIRILRLNFCLNCKFLKPYFLSYNWAFNLSNMTAPCPYIHPEKSEKYLDQKRNFLIFFLTSGLYRSNYDIRDIQLSIIVILFELL